MKDRCLPWIDKAEARRRVKEGHLRTQLLQLQADLEERDEPYVVLIYGHALAGRGEVVNLLHEWADTRRMGKRLYSDDPVSDRPHLFAAWDGLARKGQLAVHFGGWYLSIIRGLQQGVLSEAECACRLREIAAMERMWALEGVRILKVWLYLDPEGQQHRLASQRADVDKSWKITAFVERNVSIHEPVSRWAERIIDATDAAWAPWKVIHGRPRTSRNLQVVEQVLSHGQMTWPTPPREEAAPLPAPDEVPALIAPGSMGGIDKKAYKKRLDDAQGRLARLSRRLLQEEGRSMVLVFEGWDAAGKGGAIRRLLPGLDARWVDVRTFGAPTKVEAKYPYLWRFWQAVPQRGRITIFDRSWYGRVLVEPIEGFCSEADARRAHGEIRDFEAELVRDGVVVLKFWLQVSPEEQMARFKAREQVPWKHYKITEEDYRNRAKRAEYETWVARMLRRTHTPQAPWLVVDSEDKRHARVQVIEAVVKTLEDALS